MTELDLTTLAAAQGGSQRGGARRCLVSTMRAMLKGQGRPFADIAAAREYLSG